MSAALEASVLNLAIDFSVARFIALTSPICWLIMESLSVYPCISEAIASILLLIFSSSRLSFSSLTPPIPKPAEPALPDFFTPLPLERLQSLLYRLKFILNLRSYFSAFLLLLYLALNLVYLLGKRHFLLGIFLYIFCSLLLRLDNSFLHNFLIQSLPDNMPWILAKFLPLLFNSRPQSLQIQLCHLELPRLDFLLRKFQLKIEINNINIGFLELQNLVL